MKQLLLVLTGFVLPVLLLAQRKDTIPNTGELIQARVNKFDSIIDRVPGVIITLKEVTVEAFHSNQQWKAIPAAVAVLGSKEMNRYSNTSFVPVFNTVPGVRVEERSPASYRLSIRGSLLRSPFGVRNVKVYWNDIPLSDAGGNTYLNLVDLNTLTGAEVVKGPAASVYGAGTGGAVLLRSDLNSTVIPENHFTAGITGGSYGLFNEQLGWQYQAKNFSSSLQQVHQQSDGYRDQSATRKDVLKWQSALQLKHQQLQFLLFYTDLYYQTPGGINLAQFQSNPKLSRQPAGAIPGSIQQQASIYNKTIFGGAHHAWEMNDRFTLKSFVTGNHTSFINPFITNYETRGEANFGAGTDLIYKHKNFQWMNGAEWLRNHSLINDFGNRGGVKDTVQFKDDIYATQWFAFSQAQLSVGEQWVFTAGLSLNNQSFRFKRTTVPNIGFTDKNISMVVTPRIAVLYRINKDVSLYALAAKGFSPPAVAELRPSDGLYHGELDAESGWNIETGIKGELFAGRLQFDIAAYFFRLDNAIVRRTTSTSAEFFVNAGNTKQNGMEGLLKYQMIKKQNGFLKGLVLWTSYSYQPYRFNSYEQSGVDFSGKELTGVPRNIWVSGLDLDTKTGIYLNTSVNATSAIPLNDANSVYAEKYELMQAKLGYRWKNKKTSCEFFFGVDNLLNQSYSLGNDINALGNRYYNAATGRNIFAGIICRF